MMTAGVIVPASAQSKPGSHTQVVVLGTGTPYPDPDRSGPAVAIVVNDTAYLVDCGTGVVRRAKQAENSGITALRTESLKTVFITHLHSDHTLGYPDLIFTPWIMERKEPLQAYGPRGLKEMTDHIEQAWAKDIRIRTEGAGRRNRAGGFDILGTASPRDGRRREIPDPHSVERAQPRDRRAGAQQALRARGDAEHQRRRPEARLIE